MTFRVAIVNSVSTPSQATTEKVSLEEQDRDNHHACQTHNWPVVAVITIVCSRDYLWLHEIIRDSTDYACLVELIEADAVDLIVVRHYDRLWSTSALQAQVSALCRQHRVQVYAVMQPKEPLLPDAIPRRPGLQGIMESLSGILRDEEQNIRVARHRVGMIGRVKRGLHHPGSAAPYGYQRGPDGLMIPHPAEAEWVRWMFRRRLEGWGKQYIAAHLIAQGVPPPALARPGHHQAEPNRQSVWYSATVGRILQNPVYAGQVHWGDFSNEQGAHEPLISKEDFARAQEIASARGITVVSKPENWLTGLVFCRACGRRMQYYTVTHRSKGKQTRGQFIARRLYWRCGTYLGTHGVVCSSNGYMATKLEQYVLHQIFWAFDDPQAYLQMRAAQLDEPGLRKEMEGIHAALADCQGRLSRWERLYEVGGLTADEFLGHRARIETEAAALTPRARELERRLTASATAPDLGGFAEAREYLYEASSDELRSLANVMIREVSVERGLEPEIRWR